MKLGEIWNGYQQEEENHSVFSQGIVTIHSCGQTSFPQVESITLGSYQESCDSKG